MECIIVLTYRCNAHCHMCGTWQHPSAEKEEIGCEVLRKLPQGIRFANITGGEPFLREDIDEAVQTVRSKAKRVVISTNGYYTDRILEVAKKNPGIGFRISLEGLPAANDELRGLKDGFDHGLRTLLRLHEAGVRDIGFGITLSDRNAGDLMELYSLARWLGVEFSTAAVHNSYYFHKSDNRIENPGVMTCELRKLIGSQLRGFGIKSWFRGYFNYGLINYIEGRQRLLRCAMGSGGFLLDPFGAVRPCNGMEAEMGNLKLQTFDEIWTSDQAAAVRESVRICSKNCWMIGSAAPAMKKEILKPALWILRQKLGGWRT